MPQIPITSSQRQAGQARDGPRLYLLLQLANLKLFFYREKWLRGCSMSAKGTNLGTPSYQNSRMHVPRSKAGACRYVDLYYMAVLLRYQ